jgi:hypothetical protein
MHSKTMKPQKPEDMILRVIRVAEILVKSQEMIADKASVKPLSNQAAVSAIRLQKTQP